VEWKDALKSIVMPIIVVSFTQSWPDSTPKAEFNQSSTAPEYEDYDISPLNVDSSQLVTNVGIRGERKLAATVSDRNAIREHYAAQCQR